jgi:hypothetical protein
VERPAQSWQYQGMQKVQTATAAPVLVAGILHGVTRCDTLQTFSLRKTLQRGGQGCILISRLVHEIAYKIARAPKYGS